MKNRMRKLNLGSGSDYRKDFVNVDIRSDVGADLVHDITKPFPFSSGTVSEIIAQDVLEHLTLEQQSAFFLEAFRLLVKGGRLFVRIPNNEDIWERFSDDPDTRNLFLFGDTSESGVWGSHKSGHTLGSFLELSAISGFRTSKHSSVTTNYEFEFIKSDLPKLKGIVFINQTFGMGGAENFMTQLLSHFRKSKIPVAAWTTYEPFNKSLKFQGIKAGKIPVSVDIIGDWKGLIKGIILLPLASVYYAYLVYKNRQSGTILLSGFTEKILATPWAKFFNVPVVWIEYGPLQSVFTKFFSLPKFLYRLVSKLPDRVIEPSENTRVGNQNIAGISAGRTKIVPCGISPMESFRSAPKKLTAYCVSRLEPGKGQDLLIKAWPKVLAKFSRARLFLIGEGDFKPQLTRIVDNLNIGSSVTFLGRVDNLAKEVSPLTLGVFPSVWPLEGFGLVLLEAMSLGKPIVCFNWGPYPEIVNPDCAVLVEKNNIEEFSKAIIRIFSQPKFAKKLGENGRKRFNQFYTVDKVAPRYEKVLLQAQIAAETRSYLNDK